MKTTLLAAGIFALLIGLVWIGQGTGYFPYPQSSFMISQIKWAYYGAGLGVVGLISCCLGATEALRLGGMHVLGTHAYAKHARRQTLKPWNLGDHAHEKWWRQISAGQRAVDDAVLNQDLHPLNEFR